MAECHEGPHRYDEVRRRIVVGLEADEQKRRHSLAANLHGDCRVNLVAGVPNAFVQPLDVGPKLAVVTRVGDIR